MVQPPWKPFKRLCEPLEAHHALKLSTSLYMMIVCGMIGIQCCRNIDDVDKTMEEINEQTENMKMIQDALSTPFGVAADFDEVDIFHTLIQIYV